MADRTPSSDNVSVSHIEYHASLIGTVWIVAFSAIATRHRVIHVRSFESEFFNLMALDAEGRRFPL